jgi:hypothetical protein
VAILPEILSPFQQKSDLTVKSGMAEAIFWMVEACDDDNLEMASAAVTFNEEEQSDRAVVE